MVLEAGGTPAVPGQAGEDPDMPSLQSAPKREFPRLSPTDSLRIFL